jgi:hypothetical protein
VNWSWRRVAHGTILTTNGTDIENQ